MTRLQVLILIIIISSVIAYFNANRVRKEGHSFAKTFIVTLAGGVGLFFAIINLLNK